MADKPGRNLGHSEIVTLPDDISFDSDVGGFEGPSFSDEDFFSMYLDMALNDALKEEMQHLEALTGQNLPNGGAVLNFPPSNHQFYSLNQALNTMLTAQQFQ